MPRRPSLHTALQLELGPGYASEQQSREGRVEPAACRDPYLPGHDSHMAFRCNLALRQAFQASCYARGLPYTERLRQLMAADLAQHPVE